MVEGRGVGGGGGGGVVGDVDDLGREEVRGCPG